MKKTATIKVVWEKGTAIKHRPPAEDVYNELNRIKDQHGGKLVPAVVVEEARDKESPIHPCFEWNDKIAANSYRIDQARTVIRSIRVIEEADGESPVHRIAFINVSDEEGRSYQDSETVMSTPELRKSALEDAVIALAGLQRRYDHLTELASVWKEVGKMKRKIDSQKE